MRDYSDKAYAQWRKAVFSRDKYKCRKCGVRRKLQAHHIQTWANTPQLRYVLSNGITLCKKCHGSMWGNERAFELLCRQLLMDKNILIQVRMIMRGLDLDEV